MIKKNDINQIIKTKYNPLNIIKEYNLNKNLRYSLKVSSAILIVFVLIFSIIKFKKRQKKIDFKYFACFGTIARKENLYIRDLISYYLTIGFEKFIFGDNNFPDEEKLSDVLQDYINKGIVDIIEVYGSSISQSEFFGIIYDKYKTKCGWISFFDVDEYLRMHFEDNRSISIKEYLSNNIFEKCESISINWLIYSDNNLLYYENRSVLERFTSPNIMDKENKLVKSIIRGNLNKKVFYPLKSNHVPNKRVIICNSLGKRLKHYDSFYLKPPLLKYAYLMHFTTKTAEEYISKLKRGENGNSAYNITDRIEIFFRHNNYTEKKIKMFENAFNRSFSHIHIYTNLYIKLHINIQLFIFNLLCLYY